MSNAPSSKPKEWKSAKIKDCLTSISAGASPICGDSPAQPGEIGVLKTSAIGNGVFDPSENKKLLAASTQSVKTPVRANTLLICRKNTPELVGGVAYVDRAHPYLFLPDLLWELTAKPDIDARYFGYVLQSPPIQAAISSSASGSSRSMANISMGAFGEILVALAPLPEQRRIAEILRTWDEAIEKLAALCMAKERRRDALIYSMVFGARRLSNFDGQQIPRKHRWFDVPKSWDCKPIGDVAEEVSERNREGEHEVLSCSKYQGFVRSLEYFNKQVFSSNLSGYKVIRRGEFGFPSNHVEEGSIGLQNLVDTGLVSPIYTVFRFDPEVVDNDYAFAVLKTSLYRHIFEVSTSASVDRRGSLRWSEFSKIPFPLPPLEEQRAIVAAIQTSRAAVDATAREITALQRQKRGLMQKLLTGEWRVIGNSEGANE